MGLFDLFKKREQKVVEDIPYSNDYEIKVDLFVSHPSIFDSEAIHKNLSEYFENYFKQNIVNDYKYFGMGLMFGPAMFGEECKVRIIFDEEVIEFLNDYGIREWKSNISKLTGMPVEYINIVYMTGDDEVNEMNQKMKAIEAMDRFSSKMDETNSKMKDGLKAMKEENKKIKDILKGFDDIYK